MAADEKARLYRLIVQAARDEVVLEQMRLHGFWDPKEPLPEDPPAEIEERAALEAEAARLRQQQTTVENVDAALAEERRRRWEASKARRAARKAEARERHRQRRAAWEAARKETLFHAGLGVSGGLQHTQSDVAQLTRRQLPILHTAADVARELGISLDRLKWLTYHRNAAALVHYHRYDIPKKTGGIRAISAPKPALAAAQRWVLENVLEKLEIEPMAHGFIPTRSIVTNALPHVGKAVVLNLDVKEFFPTVTFRRVKGLFFKVGYSEQVAVVLALICTEPPRVAAEVGGKVFHVALGARVLPQGACTSPAITNAVCRKLDRRLEGLAQKHGFTYTRYADDLTLSGDDPRPIGRLLRSVTAILGAEGFVVNDKKTKVMRRATRQEVTGLTVNVKPSVSRSELRTLRAILHNAARHGLASQNRTGHPDFAGYLRGKVAYVCMVAPARATIWQQRLRQALKARPDGGNEH